MCICKDSYLVRWLKCHWEEGQCGLHFTLVSSLHRPSRTASCSHCGFSWPLPRLCHQWGDFVFMFPVSSSLGLLAIRCCQICINGSFPCLHYVLTGTQPWRMSWSQASQSMVSACHHIQSRQFARTGIVISLLCTKEEAPCSEFVVWRSQYVFTATFSTCTFLKFINIKILNLSSGISIFFKKPRSKHTA